MKKKTLLLFLPLTAMALAGCGENPDPKPQCDSAVVTLDQQTLSLKVGESKTIGSSISVEGCTISWSSDNEAVATVDQTGKVTGVAEGTANITANGKTCAVTVTKGDDPAPTPEHAGTEDDPFTPADAALVAGSLEQTSDSKNPIATEEMYYIRGEVSKLAKDFEEQYGSYSFWLGNDEFEVWQIYNGESKAKFNEGDIAPGFIVTIKAKIMNFKGTPENTTDAFVVKIDRGSAPVPASIDSIVSGPTEVEVGDSLNASDFTLKIIMSDGSAKEVKAASVTCDTSVVKDDATLTLTYGELDAFVTTIKVVAEPEKVNGDFYKIKNQDDIVAGTYLIAYTTETETKAFAGVDASNGYVAATREKNHIIASEDLVKVELEAMDGGFAIKVLGGANAGKYIYGTSGKNSLSFGDEQVLNVVTHNDKGDQIVCNSTFLMFNKNSDQQRFRYYKTEGQQAVSLFKMYEAPVPVVLESISADLTKKIYTEGDALDLSSLVVTGHYSDGSEAVITEGITTSLTDGAILTADDTEVEVFVGDFSAKIALVINPVPEPDAVLQSIEVTTELHRSFFVGDAFVKETVMAHYDKGDDRNVTDKATFSGYDMEEVAASQTVTVSYTEGEVTKEATYNIEVKVVPVLDSIEITTAPSKTEYTEGETFDPTDMVVTAHFTGDKADEDVTAKVTYSDAALVASADPIDFEISYTDGEITKTDTVQITVGEKERATLPYIVDADGGAFEGWDSEGTGSFATNLIKLDSVGDYVQALKLIDKKSSVRIMIDSYLNGTGKEPSEVKVSALNDAGETVASDVYEPLQKSASSESAGRTAGEEGRVSFVFSGTDITGFKIEATVKTANIVLTKVQITEPPVPVSSVTLSDKTMNLEYPGEDGTLIATVLPDNAEMKDLEWTVEGSSVTVVDGVVTPIAVGESTVTATAKDGSGASDSCVVTVSAKEATLESIEISGTPQTVYSEGDSYNHNGLVVNATYSDKSVVDVTDSVTWNISKATAELGDSTINIEAILDGESDDIDVTVTVNVADLQETLTVSYLGIGTSYGDFLTAGSTSGFLFGGNGTTSSQGGIQIRGTSDKSGIYTRTSNRYIKSITVEFDNANGKTISVYGQQEGYKGIDGTPTGTLLGSVTANNTIDVDGEYMNICIVSTGATYIKNIVLAWDGIEQASSVDSVTLNKETADLGVEEELTLSAIVDGSGCSQEIDWETSDSTKASVTDGVVRGLDAGEVTITAKSHDDNSVFAECVVNVTNESTLMCADFTTKAASHSKYDDTWTYGDFSLTCAANNNGGWDYIKLGAKSGTSGTVKETVGIIGTENTTETAITKILVDIAAGSLSKSGMSVTEWGIKVYSDSTKATLIDQVISETAIAKTAFSESFAPSEGKTWGAGCYFEIYFNCSNTTTTNGVVCVSKVSFIG